MDHDIPDRKTVFETMLRDQLVIARGYVDGIDRNLRALLFEQDATRRTGLHNDIRALQSQLDEANGRAEFLRAEIVRLDSITIDEFRGNCTVCRQHGHKTGECTVQNNAD
ncbi:uncharacterized protein RCC_08695 [Ramularia collo-cygni]|uniref:Uncharacterized protein n=1 Tax=Ramularia collo-cygni TaxID=112498 RepID=A0A2D3UY49_9PEZI|nr:uncharacterized protein RCC_08695 [Ramularia collo-cygni]CZT22987.1 uncharacterized protein RCC_08695 [Ramularia collo-cygni]